MASNTARQLNNHYTQLTASTQRLSSGLRINSAADDAAGLAIRELMRSDMAALHQGVRNANDAISLIQTADGALGIIDEKLIRMKELAEQAATGTYDSTQRLMIHSEFQAMAAEIDRIANATDFNGIKLLDGSLSGAHAGNALQPSGAMKIHFGTANDSAEDYYYIAIGDCTTAGLGLREGMPQGMRGEMRYEDVIAYPPYSALNDYKSQYITVPTGADPEDIAQVITQQGEWYCGVLPDDQTRGSQNSLLLIKKGTKNFVFNEIGATLGAPADNDIQLFTRDGKHLAGRSPIPNYDGFPNADPTQVTTLAAVCGHIGFAASDYDASFLNAGVRVQDNGQTLNFTSYNGMTIGYSGDGAAQYDNISRYEVLTIDEVTEDLVIWLPGVAGAVFKYYTGASSDAPGDTPPLTGGAVISIDTQDKAQKALERVDAAIVQKDKVRAHLGALQNRLENTVTNLTIQSENLLASESRISDADVALDMTAFVRQQILTQSAVAMLSQANASAQMLARLLNG